MLYKRDVALAPLMGNYRVHTDASLSSNAGANGRKVKDNLKRPPLTQPVVFYLRPTGHHRWTYLLREGFLQGGQGGVCVTGVSLKRFDSVLQVSQLLVFVS